MDISIFQPDDDKKIKNLYFTVKLIRAVNDFPIVWKLNIEYMDSLCMFMRIPSHEVLMCEKFLDAAIDLTTKSPYCLSSTQCYPLICNGI